MAVAVGLGPLRFVVRAGLRLVGGKAAVTRWQRATTLGIGAGLLAAPALAGPLSGGAAAVTAAVLGLSLLLLAQDLAWRWLPLEWTLPLLALAFVAGFSGNRLGDVVIGAALGAGLLWSLQVAFRLARGAEALGSGDIWLAAGIGGVVGADTIAWVLGLAAVLGILVDRLGKLWQTPSARRRWGVAFGSHMISVFLIIWAF
jgi:prepilin signal peptidase PulO-like enzyme (type II secretory pathway)